MLRRIHSCISPQTDRKIVTEAGVQRRTDFYLFVSGTLVGYALKKAFSGLLWQKQQETMLSNRAVELTR